MNENLLVQFELISTKAPDHRSQDSNHLSESLVVGESKKGNGSRLSSDEREKWIYSLFKWDQKKFDGVFRVASFHYIGANFGLHFKDLEEMCIVQAMKI